MVDFPHIRPMALPASALQIVRALYDSHRVLSPSDLSQSVRELHRILRGVGVSGEPVWRIAQADKEFRRGDRIALSDDFLAALKSLLSFEVSPALASNVHDPRQHGAFPYQWSALDSTTREALLRNMEVIRRAENYANPMAHVLVLEGRHANILVERLSNWLIPLLTNLTWIQEELQAARPIYSADEEDIRQTLSINIPLVRDVLQFLIDEKRRGTTLFRHFNKKSYSIQTKGQELEKSLTGQAIHSYLGDELLGRLQEIVRLLQICLE